MNKKCQVFTPDNICNKMLDMANYNSNLYGKKVLENSCGDGHVLTKIVVRYIEDCINNNISVDKIKYGLEHDIYANEIDKIHRDNCVIQLNDIIREYGIADVNWNISKKDYLREDMKVKFDYIIGNPPYITYRELESGTREFVRNEFSCCKTGKFDYCYAFIEKSLLDLSKNGVLVYIIPSSIFKNKFGYELRNLLKVNITEIIDFKNIKVIPNALTSTAIIKVDKKCSRNEIKYLDYSINDELMINKENLGIKWNFDYINEEKEYRFGDFFNCSISIATLLNKIFIIPEYTESDEYIYFKENKIEKNIVKNAASPRNLNYKRKEKIIFPYFYNKKGINKYSEKEFKKNFPLTYNYLLMNKELLLKRCSDKNSKWYEFGRSQALVHLNQPKILCSTIVTNEVKAYLLKKDDIPYSGIYITSKNNSDLKFAINILNSQKFLEYVYKVGINASGNSMRITPNDIERFTFEKEDYELWKN